MCVYYFSANVYLITTARYGNFTQENKIIVENTFGKENTENNFRLYFQWYNVIHELGHSMIIYNGKINISGPEEEQLINDFAVAYWKYYGEEEKIDELYVAVNTALANIDGPDTTDDYLTYAINNWNKKKFYTFNNYGWFQFNSVKESLNKDLKLGDVLKDMGVDNFKLTEPIKLKHNMLTEEDSNKVIKEAVGNFRDWGLDYPNVYQKFSNDPNNNYGQAFHNFLGIFSLLYD